MGLITAMVGGALEGGGQAGVKLGLNEQEALIQEERAQRLKEAAKELEGVRAANAEKQTRLSDELKRAPAKEAMAKIDVANKPVMVDDGVGGGNLQAPTQAEQRANTTKALISSGDQTLMSAGAQMGEGDLNRTERSKEFEVRNAQDQRQHEERMAQTERQMKQQAAQIGIESRKVAMLESNNVLEQADKKVIRDAREAYLKETDPEKKAELGAQFLTLTGKIGERWKPIESVDQNTGQKTITGWYDGTTGRQLGKGGLGGDAPPQPSQGDIAGLLARKNNPSAVKAFETLYPGQSQKYLESAQPPVQPPVSGRSLYSVPQAELKRLAQRPKGVSPAQAEEAQRELDARVGESRLSGG